MTWAEKTQRSRGENVYLVRGKDNGRNAWYYVLVDPLKISLFLRMIEAGSLNLEDYGEVLASGWGTDPPDTVKRRITSDYT